MRKGLHVKIDVTPYGILKYSDKRREEQAQRRCLLKDMHQDLIIQKLITLRFILM